MTPDQTAVIQTIALILEKLSSTPGLLVIVLILLGPMAAVVWIVWRLPKMITKIAAMQDQRMQHVFDRQDRRHEEVVKMYESNVQLVSAYEAVTRNYHGITDNLQELVMITTQTMEKLVGKIENNRYCPLVRQKIGPGVIEEGQNNG